MKRQWYAAPYALWMLMFTIVPLLFVVYYAFQGPNGFTADNFLRVFQPGYLPVLLVSGLGAGVAIGLVGALLVSRVPE